MRLKDIIKDFPCEFEGNLDTEITDVCRDSRQASEGCMFFCIEGFESDGHEFAKAAVKAGAVVLVVTKWLPELHVFQVKVDDDRLAMAVLSANFFGNPADKMKVVGVTGTNGKTSITYLCASIAENLGKKVGVLGTISNRIGDVIIPSKNTTPESLDLQRLFAQMVDSGVEVVFMEVSSHSLFLKRVAGVEFDVGAFTNLSQDHLDFHGNMENYLSAKTILFTQSKISVINVDDEASSSIIENAEREIVTYSIDNPSNYRAAEIEYLATGNCFRVHGLKFCINIPGKFSVYNALCAIGICTSLGYSTADIQQGLAKAEGVAGRAEVLKDQPYTIILDYAHTPDGLKNILSTFKGLGRLICVFGAGGDRDRAKRPIMGKVVGECSDFAIITSDNPRNESPLSIMQEIEAGIIQTDCSYVMIEDRKAAIAYAIANAQEGDIIILAGKGHETYQEINGRRLDFDEKVIVKNILGDENN